MRWMRRNIFKILMIVSLLALTGADVECDDGELEIDWPDFEVERYYPGYWVEPVYVEPCCWFW